MTFSNLHFMLGHQNQKSFDRVAEEVVARFPDGGKILDLGAAAGEPSVTIAKKWNGTIISTDVVPENRELGIMRAKALGLSDKVEFKTADACDLSQFEDASFDGVVGTLVLMCVPDFPKACAEIARVLKPGAPLITTCWQEIHKCDVFGKGHMVLMKNFKEAGKFPAPSPGAPPHPNPAKFANAAPEGELADGLKAVGFQNITGVEHAYESYTAGKDIEDCARRMITGTPMYGMCMSSGGQELLDEAVVALTTIYVDNGVEMGDLTALCPEWSGVDNPDNIETCCIFKCNTSLFVTAEKAK